MSENFTPWDSIQSESDRKLVKLRAEVAELRAELEWLRKHTDPTDLLPLRPPQHGYPIPD